MSFECLEGDSKPLGPVGTGIFILVIILMYGTMIYIMFFFSELAVSKNKEDPIHSTQIERMEEMTKEFPELKPTVRDFYKDGIIRRSEYSEIVEEYKRLKVERMIK